MIPYFLGSIIFSCTACCVLGVSKKVSSNRMKDSFNNETLKLVIETLVISKLLYCSMVWSNTSSNNINKLQSVQNFSCRVILAVGKFDRITPALHELNLFASGKVII